MNEKLQGMVEENGFARIAIAAVDQQRQDLTGMQELTAFYLAMNWINAEEATEILAYTQQKFTPPEEAPKVLKAK